MAKVSKRNMKIAKQELEAYESMMKPIEDKIAKGYSQAQAELAKKVEQYFKAFEKKDATWQKWVKSGEKTKEEYRAWRASQMAMGKRWENMRDTIATDLANADKIASKIVNDNIPDAYALGHNWGTYEVESGIGINTSYTLYNHAAVEELLKDDPNLLPKSKVKIPKDKLWNRRHLDSAITQGILQGESIPDIAKRLETVTDMNHKAALRNARTMTGSAQNAGHYASYKRAEDMGIDIEKQWLATMDERTRTSHRYLHGETQKMEDEFSNGLMYPKDPSGEPEEVYNCFIPETNIGVDSKIIRSYKHRYEGEVISIKSSMGVNFTCTPNHPILTDRGWVKAKFLNKGDNLIVTSCIDNEVSRRNPYINHAFPRIDTIHELFYKFGGKRTSALRVNFHGDIPTSEVEIITQKRFLWSDVYTCIRKCINKFLFKDANISFSCKCPFAEHFGRVVHTTFGNISGVCKSFSIFRRCLSHANIHGLGTITDSNVIFGKNTLNNLPTNVVLPSEIKNRLASKIFVDNVVSVERSYFSGHVYNLQTDDNYYFVNSSISKNDGNNNGIMAIAHNCRCRMISNVKGYRRNLQDMYDESLMGMSYEEWLNAKPVYQKITHGEEVAEAQKMRYVRGYRNGNRKR